MYRIALTCFDAGVDLFVVFVGFWSSSSSSSSSSSWKGNNGYCKIMSVIKLTDSSSSSSSANDGLATGLV